MAKLVFLCLALAPLFIHPGSAAPLLARPRDVPTPTPAIPPTSLTLSAQQQDYSAFDLGTNLLTPSSTITPLSTLPPQCSDATTASECPNAQYAAADVTYDDCGSSWTICRCDTANMTLDAAAARLGQVPVGLRRYVATVVVAPAPAKHAYTLVTGDIHIFGEPEVDAWVHEAGHAYDWASGTPLSGSQGWTDALAADTCVPDVYSQTSAGEDFAQMTVMMVYSLLHGGALPPGWSGDCMARQMAYMAAQPTFNKDDLFGNTCAIADSQYSRHVVPPPVVPTRIQPDFPAQLQPDAPLKSSLGLPGLAAAETSEEDGTKHDNSASALYVGHAKIVMIAGLVAGWLW